MKTSTKVISALAAGAGLWALNRMRRRSLLDLPGKVVLITGGSRGLGLATAREFGAQGSMVAICARDHEELARAEADLSSRGIRARGFLCDVSVQSDVQAMVKRVEEHFGAIDILVNNAGAIKVGPFFNMDIKDFEQAMNLMFWGPLYTTLAVLPSMRQRKQGSIVNITSIGGKVSVPHLLPYSCAKFAAVGFSEGLRSELAPEGICVTTIAPGLLRTGSHLNARFKGKQTGEYLAFSAGSATPVVSIAAERAARSIVSSTVRGETERVLSVPAAALALVHGIAPGFTTDVLSLVNRLLPSEKNGGTSSRTGQQIEDQMNSRIWRFFTSSGYEAAESLNELSANQQLANS